MDRTLELNESSIGMPLTQEQVIEYYDEFYARDDFVYYSRKKTEKILRVLCARAGCRAGARVLDLGCGTGFYTSVFRQLGYDATGIDISATAIDKARQQYPDARFLVDDATNLHFERGTFELIFSLGVSVMNTHEMPKMHLYVRHLIEFLAPGGVLLFIGGSDLGGGQSRTSSWLNHRWSEILNFIPKDAGIVEGPFLTHFRLIATAPHGALNNATTMILRIPFFRFMRKVVYIVHKP